jgi:hypothetical protein
MDQFHVISLFGADTRAVAPTSDLAQATRDLNRKTLALHGRHAFAWLIRAGIVACLFLLGHFIVEGAIGGAMTWTSGFLSIYVAWFMLKGHMIIQGDRQAKLYWIRNDVSNHEFSSDDPILATMPVQEPVRAERSCIKAVS